MSKNENLTLKEVENSFASNICRCTGYRSIADAFKSFADEDVHNRVTDLEDLSFKSCTRNCSKNCDSGNCTNKSNLSKTRFNNKHNGDTSWCIIENLNDKMFTVKTPAHKWVKAYTLADVFKSIQSGDNYKLIAGNTGQGK